MYFAKLNSSSRRAISPSSLMISQITPAGAKPASRAKSTAASYIWPARLRTPISLAFKGNTWPGVTKSS